MCDSLAGKSEQNTNQEEKIKELANTDMEKKEVELKLYELYGASSIKSSPIYKHIAETKFFQETLEKHGKHGLETDFQLLKRIKDVLVKMLFASSNFIVDTLHETQNIVYRYLSNELGLAYKHSSWIPSTLDFQQK